MYSTSECVRSGQRSFSSLNSKAAGEEYLAEETLKEIVQAA